MKAVVFVKLGVVEMMTGRYRGPSAYARLLADSCFV